MCQEYLPETHLKKKSIKMSYWEKEKCQIKLIEKALDKEIEIFLEDREKLWQEDKIIKNKILWLKTYEIIL